MCKGLCAVRGHQRVVKMGGSHAGKGAPMSWLASSEVLPSPNHVLEKLAIFRGAEPSPHSPRATDSASVFYYYFKPFALFFPLAAPFLPFWFASFIPLVFLTTSAPTPHSPIPLLPPSPRDLIPCSPFLCRPARFNPDSPPSGTIHLCLSLRLRRTWICALPSPPPPPSDAPCLQAEMKISRLLAIETELLFHEVVDPFAPVPPTLSFSLALGPRSYATKGFHERSPRPLPPLVFPTFLLFLRYPCTAD